MSSINSVLAEMSSYVKFYNHPTKALYEGVNIQAVPVDTGKRISVAWYANGNKVTRAEIVRLTRI